MAKRQKKNAIKRARISIVLPSYNEDDVIALETIRTRLNDRYPSCSVCRGVGHPTTTCGTVYMVSGAVKMIPGVRDAWKDRVNKNIN